MVYCFKLSFDFLPLFCSKNRILSQEYRIIIPDFCNWLKVIIASLLKEQDFSSYSNADFKVAEEWFLNEKNHPADLPTDDDVYMKVRLIPIMTSLVFQC